MRSTRFPSSSVPSTAATGCEPSAQRSPFAFNVSSALAPSTFRLNSSELHARRNAGTWLGRVVIVRFSEPSTALRATPPMRCELRGIEIVYVLMRWRRLSGGRLAPGSYLESTMAFASVGETPDIGDVFVAAFTAAMPRRNWRTYPRVPSAGRPAA